MSVALSAVCSHPCHAADNGLRPYPPYFWLTRWEHYIRDDSDFQRHCDYIHWNPVKHGYAPTPAAWPHSTFGRFVERGVYPPDWGGAAEDMELG